MSMRYVLKSIVLTAQMFCIFLNMPNERNNNYKDTKFSASLLSFPRMAQLRCGSRRSMATPILSSSWWACDKKVLTSTWRIRFAYCPSSSSCFESLRCYSGTLLRLYQAVQSWQLFKVTTVNCTLIKGFMERVCAKFVKWLSKRRFVLIWLGRKCLAHWKNFCIELEFTCSNTNLITKWIPKCLRRFSERLCPRIQRTFYKKSTTCVFQQRPKLQKQGMPPNIQRMPCRVWWVRGEQQEGTTSPENVF